MNGILRFIGLVNAAVWLGASLFFTLGVAPAVFSTEMKTLLQLEYYPGAVAQILFARFFYFQYLCGGIAIALYLWEALYRGRKFERFTFGLLIGLLTVALVGGLWLQPKLKSLHQIRHSVHSSTEAKESAKKLFGALHGSSQAVNLLVLAGLFFYYWQLTSSNRAGSTKEPFAWKQV